MQGSPDHNDHGYVPGVSQGDEAEEEDKAEFYVRSCEPLEYRSKNKLV